MNMAKTATILVTDKTAPLLLELVTRAAVTGPQAGLLAELYTRVSVAAKLVETPAPKQPST